MSPEQRRAAAVAAIRKIVREPAVAETLADIAGKPYLVEAFEGSAWIIKSAHTDAVTCHGAAWLYAKTNPNVPVRMRLARI